MGGVSTETPPARPEAAFPPRVAAHRSTPYIHPTLASDAPTSSASSTPRLGRKGEAPAIDPRSLRPLRRLAPFLLRYPWRLGLTVAFLLIAATSSLVIPLIAGRIIDKGFLEKNLENLTGYSGLAIAIALVMAVSSAARFYYISVVGERVVTDLRRAVFDHLLTLDATFFDLHRVGELTSRLTGDVTTIRNAVGSSLSMTLRGFVVIAGAIIMMAVTSWWLTLAVLVITPAIVVPVMVLSR